MKNKDGLSRDAGILAVSLLLALTVALVYWQVRGYGFVNLDDKLYVEGNRHVVSGMSLENVRWSFTAFRASNWHPLTWISHMADCQAFGLKAGMHHLVNVLFHAVSSILLFLALYEMSGRLWRSAFVAFLFALHPLHVESVAWIAERKDVLSAFFWMLALLLYFRYARHSAIWNYLAVLAAFVLGLMSKPMVVTLPFVFLLLDYWPLGRMQLGPNGPVPAEGARRESVSRLVAEKVPFFILAAASSVVTLIAQKSGGAVASMEALAFDERLANAVVSYVVYLSKTVWPVGLAFFYPHSEAIPWVHAAAAGFVLAAVTAVSALMHRRCPYLLVGWLWYLGTLVPVIGIVQVGGQAMADRYTYVPLIGIFIMISWGAADLAASRRLKKQAVIAPAGALLLILAVLSWRQTGYWRDDMSLSMHAIEVTRGNYLAYNNLGLAMESAGRVDEAVEQYGKALEIDPGYFDARVNLGVALASQGKTGEAIRNYEQALRIRPDSAEVRINLGSALLNSGRIDDAVGHLREAVNLRADMPEAHIALGVALARKRDLDGAIGRLREALDLDPGNANVRKTLERLEAMKSAAGDGEGMLEQRLEADPGNPELHVRLGDACSRKGDVDRAIRHYREALKLDGGYVPALSRLAVAYGRSGEDKKALDVLRELAKRLPQSAEVRYNIACIYSKRGEVDEAVKWLKSAVDRGFRDVTLMEKDRDLDNIRGSAYYRRLVGLQ